ncbi:MAG: site-specific integrase, partial [Clostridiales bacterium]|nr:site-specific integrase [Clostridiales bacterium]
MATAKKLPSGRWRCLVYVGKSENGKRKYKSCTADSKKEAIALAADMQLNYELARNPLKLTLGQAIDRYIDNRSNI